MKQGSKVETSRWMAVASASAAACVVGKAVQPQGFLALPSAEVARPTLHASSVPAVAPDTLSPAGGVAAAGVATSSVACAAMVIVSAGALSKRSRKLSAGNRPSRMVRRASAGGAPTATVSLKDSYLYAQIGEIVKGSAVVVFSKSTCPFCTKAKRTLEAIGARYQLVELDQISPQTALMVQEVLGQITGARTVPRVFVGGRCIGGGDDTVSLKESGQLETMVAAAQEDYKKSLRGEGDFQVKKDDEQWLKELDQEKFRILRRRGTEPPGSHPFNEFLPTSGHFACAGCGLPLYSAESKFASSCGWPVFDKCYGSEELGQHVDSRPDGSGSLEIICTRCGGHLGHVFYDAITEENPNGERH